MKYILMNKETPILEMSISDKGYIKQITDCYNLDYMPIGIPLDKNIPDIKMLEKWWQGRSIPMSRDGIKNFLYFCNIDSPMELINKSFGLSLSDQYWINPINSPMKWTEINFFDNQFSEDIGNLLFHKTEKEMDKINFVSPDNTSDGWLKKKWIFKDNKAYLLKGGSDPFHQEPFNEVLASYILKQQNQFDFVEYKMCFNNGKENPACICENFITKNTELVPATALYASLPKANHISPYQHIINCIKHYEIPNTENYLDYMITFDYLIANTDRHWHNFGFIRNVETLKFVGPAPIFDNGTSLWHNKIKASNLNVESRPFRNHHDSQIKLVKNSEILDVSTFKDVGEYFNNLLKDNIYIDGKRRDSICKGLDMRVNLLTRELNRLKGIEQ